MPKNPPPPRLDPHSSVWVEPEQFSIQYRYTVGNDDDDSKVEMKSCMAIDCIHHGLKEYGDFTCKYRRVRISKDGKCESFELKETPIRQKRVCKR